MKQSILVVITGMMLLACSKEENKIIHPALITGVWQLEQVTFNQTDGADINDWISNSTVLSLDESKSYYRNYLNGEWRLNGKTLILDPVESFPNFLWEYEVLKLEENKLTLRITLSESDYCCNFDQFEADEVLTITETYLRIE